MSLKIQCFDIHNNCRETCHNAHHNSRCDTQRKTNRDTQCEAIRYSCNSRNIFPIKFIQNLILKNLLWHHHWNNCKPAALSKHRIVVLVNAQEYLEWQTRLETIPLVINTNILKFFFPILQIQTWVMFLKWFAIRVCKLFEWISNFSVKGSMHHKPKRCLKYFKCFIYEPKLFSYLFGPSFTTIG